MARVAFPPILEKRDYEGKVFDLVNVFFEQEFATWPVSQHDDMLDCLARLCDEEMAHVLRKPRHRYSKRERMRLIEEHCPPSPMTPGYNDWASRHEKRSRYN